MRVALNARILITAILALTIAGFSASAQTSNGEPERGASEQMSIEGTSVVPESTIRSLFAKLPRDSALVRLQAIYADNGYLDARIDAVGDSVVRVREGRQYRFGSVSIVPDSVASLVAARLEFADALQGNAFTSAAVSDRLEFLVSALNDRGYPLAAASVRSIDVVDTSGTVDLAIALEPGELVRIEEIDVTGNTETSASLIRTAAAVDPGTPFTDELATDVRRRLERLNIFATVADPQLYRGDSGRYGLLIHVEEGNPNTLDGLIGYQPSSSAQDRGSFTGLLNVVFRNIFGTGRRFSLRWQPNPTTTELEVRYAEPFILGLPFDAEAWFLQHQEEGSVALPSFVQRGIGVDVTYGLSDLFNVRLGGAFEETIPELDTLAPCDQQLLNSRTVRTTLGIEFDSRTNPINPTSGLRIATSFSLGNKLIRNAGTCSDSLTGTTQTHRTISADVDAYLRIAGPLLLASGAHGGEVAGDLLELSDLFYFGGHQTVRGYRENEIRASRRIWGTLEPRLLLSATSFVGAFFDLGYYLRPEDRLRGIARFDDVIYGYGVAGQFDSPLGVVSLSVALSKDDPSLETAKVFVGLVNQF